MLRAFEAQLKRMADETSVAFRSEITKRLGKEVPQELEDGLKNFILLTPKIINRIYYHWNVEKTHSDIKRLGGFMLTYLYHPTDFLSTKKYQLFGYLDDAYLVCLVYEKVIEEILTAEQPFLEQDREYFEELMVLKPSIKLVIPDEASKIEALLESLIQEKYESYEALFQASG